MIHDPFQAPDEAVRAGMMAVNALSLPFRGLNIAINGLVTLLVSIHPVAKEAIEIIGKAIHDTWSQSALAHNWAEGRVRIMGGFQQELGIPLDETAYFLDSLEELMLAGGTEGVALIAKAAYKSAKRFAGVLGQLSEPQLMEMMSHGYPVVDGVHFNPATAIENQVRPLVLGPLEGYIEYQYVKGSQNSILIYLDFIQKGKSCNWHVPSSVTQGHPAYSTSKAGLAAIKDIAKEMGAARIFLQFEPVNPKFHAFVAKQYPLKGLHYIEDSFWGKLGPFPVFELTSATQSIGRQVLNITTPFIVSETLRVLSDENQSFYEELYSPFIEPALNAIDKMGKTPLHYAIEQGNLPGVKLLVERGAALDQATSDGYFPLNLALMKQDQEMVSYLLSKGAPVDQVMRKSGMTALHQVMFYIQPGNIAIVEKLIAAGATLNLLDGVWKTPLHYAIENKNLPAVKLLVESGIPLDNPTPDKYLTNAHYCEVAAKLGNREILYYIIEKSNQTTALGRETLRTHGANRMTDEYLRAMRENLCNVNWSRTAAMGSNSHWVNNHNMRAVNKHSGNVYSGPVLGNDSQWTNYHESSSSKGADNRSEIGSSGSNCSVTTTYGRVDNQCYTDRDYHCFNNDGEYSSRGFTRDYSSCNSNSGGSHSSSSGDCVIS